MSYDYEKNGEEIYRRSFAMVREETDLVRFSDAERDIVVRMIHACGMVDLAKDVVISTGAVKVGRKALANGATIICDVEMVQRGIIYRNLPANNKVLCNVATDVAQSLATAMDTTRSVGGIASLESNISGGIIAIGNAPTALFHLLEMLEHGTEPPALIIGCPVGFVGAVESKDALISDAGDIPFITIRGRRGGSAIAASVVNALCSGKRS